MKRNLQTTIGNEADLIVSAAVRAYQITSAPPSRSDVSMATSWSRGLTKCWQNLAEGTQDVECRSEVPVSTLKPGNAFIDLIEDRRHIAYELKVSSNNPRHEFYKDIFKALAYNEEHLSEKITRLKFMTPSAGAERLLKDQIAQKALQLAKKLGLSVEIVPLQVP